MSEQDERTANHILSEFQGVNPDEFPATVREIAAQLAAARLAGAQQALAWAQDQVGVVADQKASDVTLKYSRGILAELLKRFLAADPAAIIQEPTP